MIVTIYVINVTVVNVNNVNALPMIKTRHITPTLNQENIVTGLDNGTMRVTPGETSYNRERSTSKSGETVLLTGKEF